jgi:hypothetical protein
VVLESTGIKGSWEEAVGTLQQVVTLKLLDMRSGFDSF